MNEVQYNPPDNDEIEISLFGNGYGESILIHLGNKNWFVVDSFINPESGNPIILDYFEQIKQNTNDISHVLASHWHDDHIQGLSQIIEKSNNTIFIYSEALKHNEFITLISSESICPIFSNSGVTEFYKILNILKNRGNSNRKSAISDRILFQNIINKSEITIYSLSPSSLVVENSKTEIVKLLPKENSNKIKIVNHSINETSVVLLIMIDGIGILLGSDLENNESPDYGWKNVIEATIFKDKKVNFFKIPHHGSKTGYSEDLWLNYISKDSVSILTPFINGKNNLPTNEGKKILLDKNEEIYITSSPTLKRKIKRENIVEKMIDQAVKNITVTNNLLGHIRIRFKVDELENKKIDLYKNAVKLTL